MTARSNFQNGVPELVVLRLLAEQSMYGYELGRAVRERTGDVIKLGEGVLYPVLHGLESQGSLSSRSRTVNGRKRVYYRVTAKGRRRLERLGQDYLRVRSALDRVLGDAPDVAPAL